MECSRLKTGVFFRIEETNSPGWTWTVATQVTDTPFVLDTPFGLDFMTNI